MNEKMYLHSRVERPGLEGRFAELYRSELKYVWSSLRRLGTPAAELEDLCQEVFVRVFRALPDYDPDRPFRPWLFAVLFHTMLDFRKRDSRNPAGLASADEDTVSDPEILPDQVLEREENKKMVLKALESIKLDRRTVFVMVE